MAKKDVQLNVRVSKEAKQLIADNAKLLDMKQGEYIETIARKGLNQVVEILNPKLSNEYESIVKMLDRMGNNINQISTKINSHQGLTPKNIDSFKRMAEAFNLLYSTLTEKEEKRNIFNNQEE
ncbi:plasmid mobilization protein [Pseudomonas sp. NPDC047961]